MARQIIARVYDERVIPDKITIPDDGDYVTWLSSDGGAFSVDFNKDGTPFNLGHFDQAHPASGLALRHNRDGYRYTAQKQSGHVLDPVIIVK